MLGTGENIFLIKIDNFLIIDTMFICVQVMAQCNLSFEKILAPSRDPSPTLPFWDKMRLLYHGRLTIIAKQFTVLLHASLDPYNTTEEMELTWNNCGVIWTNAKLIFKGELNVCKM